MNRKTNRERFWSPESVKDVEDMYERLAKISLSFEWLGITHVKNQDMMLRRLTSGADITPMKTLVDVIEPLNDYQRWGDFKESNGFTLKSFSPYSRIMDVANPDSDKAREFNHLVNGYLLNPTDASRKEISEQLLAWKENQGALQGLINTSPVLKEIESLSADLSIISELGMESLGYISANTAPTAKWIEESKLQLRNARKPRGQTILMIVNTVELLFNHAQKK